MKKERIGYLIKQYRDGLLTTREAEELRVFFTDPENRGVFVDMFDEITGTGVLQTEFDEELLLPLLRRTLAVDKPVSDHAADISSAPAHRVHFLRRGWFRYAAVFLVIVTVAAYFLNTPDQKQSPVSIITPSAPQDLPPGGQRAMLTLASGETIILDSANIGQLAQEGGATIVKSADGKIIYNTLGTGLSEAVTYNTMSTPRGGQYQLTLPDGTRVWLNAASSITYPTAFAANERSVKVKGEVYFEVTRDKRRPFTVVLEHSSIEVLGTSFNVNAYPDEAAIRTTLLEGSVRILQGSISRSIKPGQQSRVDQSGEIGITGNVDVDAVVAWKNGYFSFENADLPTILRQLARWYDLDIQFGDNLKNRRFSGEVSMNTNLSEVLSILERSKVYCRVEGRKLFVLP